jgi:hypothetical protein
MPCCGPRALLSSAGVSCEGGAGEDVDEGGPVVLGELVEPDEALAEQAAGARSGRGLRRR